MDEYDKPLLGHLGEPTVQAIQKVLKQFYGVIKTTESSQRFALITGVSKFTKVSIFSDLNNLTDLTMDPRTATLLGVIIEAEVSTNIGSVESERLEMARRMKATGIGPAIIAKVTGIAAGF